jgi:hypothetical protein
MSFFEDASLVLIPSAYKDQKVYSVKPTDGTGDLTFSRASSATRVQSDGLIEKVRTNQVLQSETLDNAYWNKTNVSITANALANPLNGALTADLLTVTDPSGPVEKTITTQTSQSFTAGIPYTASAYFKAGTISTQFKILAYDGTALYQGGIIDLEIIGNSTAPYEDVGGGWYRFRFTFTPANSTSTGFIYLVNYAFGIAANAGTNVYVYGAQIETGDIATDYIATTTAAVSVGPVSGLPRLDYLGSTCPRLLLEPQRSNLVTFSEQFDNAAWTKLQASITANSIVSPDGYTNADTLTADGTSNEHQLRSTGVVTLTSGTTYTTSIFVKAGTNNFVQFIGSGSIYSATTYANFNVATGVVGDVGAGTTASIVAYGNGWYRCSMTALANTTDSTNTFLFNIVTSNTAIRGESNTLSTSVYVWGAQIEQGAYATSYIPTLSTSVTRVKDEASKTGISSLIGQAAGTFYAEIEALSDDGTNRTLSLSDGTSANRVLLLYQADSNKMRAQLSVSGQTRILIDSVQDTTQKRKLACAWNSTSFVFYIDGVKINEISTGYTFSDTLSDLRFDNISSGSFLGEMSGLLLFTSKLTNDQLAELTA